MHPIGATAQVVRWEPPWDGRAAMKYSEIDQTDRDLIRAASEVLERNYLDSRHTVGAAVLCASGKTYVGVNIESCGYGPCAEPITIGRAISDGERELQRIVAVGGPGTPHEVRSPCGNCRQLLMDYAPDCWVILPHGGKVMKIKARDLLPDAYRHFD
jgi:cytidine deaminase